MRWDLECFFSGGSRSVSLQHEIESISSQINGLLSFSVSDDLLQSLTQLQQIDLHLREVESFICCLEAQDVSDDRAAQISNHLAQLKASFEQILIRFDEALLQLDESRFQDFLNKAEVVCPPFILLERRIKGSQKLPGDQEHLISDLSIDGFHSWWNIYCALVGRLRVERDGKKLSVGQAENLLSHPDRSVRKEVFAKWELLWKEQQGLFSQVLNHLSGFRLKVYQHRGWTSFLKEPLMENRMTEPTLNAMWKAVVAHKAPFVKFLNEKGKMLQCGKIAWHDVEAPFLEKVTASISYEEASSLITEQFDQFSSNMGAFARRAFKENWIEAEDRPGKRPGGFCIAFPKSRQSRIFMTYSGTALNVATLAHELGHGYHNAMVEQLPSFAQHYRMNIAETASTFAEMIVLDSLVKKCTSPEEKRSLLAEKIQRSVAFLMNIHARFIFEEAFYTKRSKGFLSAEEISALMKQSQELAYCDALSEWHPHFWAAKMHFYFSDLSFYNFPYTFGYLFSLGLYARAMKEGAGFAEKYDALLRDSGQMEVEELAKKHFEIDLTTSDFWDEAVQLAVNDVESFFEIV